MKGTLLIKYERINDRKEMGKTDRRSDGQTSDRCFKRLLWTIVDKVP